MPDDLRGFDHFEFNDLRQTDDEQKIRDISAEVLNEVGYGDLLGEHPQQSVAKTIGDAAGGEVTDLAILPDVSPGTGFLEGGDFIL